MKKSKLAELMAEKFPEAKTIQVQRTKRSKELHARAEKICKQIQAAHKATSKSTLRFK